VAASVLDTLLAASGSPDSGFQVAAVVTQPPAAKNRGRKLLPSAVAQLALDRGFPEELIFTPERAREVPCCAPVSTILESGSCKAMDELGSWNHQSDF
jgi:methionyl-tRNA formyltransferase